VLQVTKVAVTERLIKKVMKMEGQAFAKNSRNKGCNLLLMASYEINMQCSLNLKFLMCSYIIRRKERERFPP
jgi:hypothetical protein